MTAQEPRCPECGGTLETHEGYATTARMRVCICSWPMHPQKAETREQIDKLVRECLEKV